MKEILMGEKAREKLLAGANKLCDIVGLTLGPCGRNVIIISRGGFSLVTNDGVTIAKSVALEDEAENIAAKIILQASQKTNEKAGDGTTSAIVLATAIMNEASKAIQAGEDPMKIKDEIIYSGEFAAKSVEENAQKIETEESLRAIAFNSCANEIDGRAIAEAFIRVGKDGCVTMQDCVEIGTRVTFADGCEVEAMLASPLFATNAGKGVSEFSDCIVIVSKKGISSIRPFIPVMERCVKENIGLAIFAPDFSNEVIQALLVNKMRGGLNVAPCKVINQNSNAVCEDIAALCGIEDIENYESPTTVKKLIAGKDSTTIVVSGRSEGMKAREEIIQAQIDSAKDEYSRFSLKRRLARLNGCVAIVHVGAATDAELREKKLRIEDAISATRAALVSGITAGGGLSYMMARSAINNDSTGADILRKALCSVARKIYENANENPDEIISRIEEEGAGVGFDVRSRKLVNMVEQLIIDPAIVVSMAIRNASSAAATLLTTECVVI